MQDDEPGHVLRILSGLHAGAECALPARPFTIGAEPPADIILHDEGVAALHLVLEPDGDDLRLIVRADGVLVEGTPLKQGDAVVTALPAELVLGGVQLRCEPSVSVIADRSGPHPPVVVRPATALLPRTLTGRVACAGALTIVLIALFAFRATSSDLAGKRARAGVALAAARLKQDERNTVPAQINTLLLRRETSREMAALGISGVTLAVDAGIVTARGSITRADETRLHDLELWFDHRFGEGAVFLSDITTDRAEPLAVALEAVWAGPDPNIIVHNQKYFLGGILPDGSVVEKITSKSITLRQHDRQYQLDY